MPKFHFQPQRLLEETFHELAGAGEGRGDGRGGQGEHRAGDRVEGLELWDGR